MIRDIYIKGVAPDGSAVNSDATYTLAVPSGTTQPIPDSVINVNSVSQGSLVSVKTIDVNLNVTPDSISLVGNELNIEVPTGGGGSVGATLMKTGQTTSYITGDDGDLQAGREVDFFILPSENTFGNTNRFTDELGGQDYVNNWVIDWSTYNGSNVLGYYRLRTTNKTFNVSVTECLGTFGGFSSCRLPNIKELFNLVNLNDINYATYAPFSFPTNIFRFWGSTTSALDTDTAFTLAQSNNIIVFGKANGNVFFGYMPVRTFTVTGTTLT